MDKVNGVVFEELHWGKKVFPLQTIQSMAERWGVHRNAVSNWMNRHSNFPQPLEGIIEKTGKTPKVFPLYEIERYEKERGLK